MDLLDLMVEVERYMSVRGLSYSDSIETLITAMSEDAEEQKCEVTKGEII